MDPRVFGPHLWFVIHMVANNYPKKPTFEDQQLAKRFIESLPITIPCEHCASFARMWIISNEYESKVHSRIALQQYFWKFHNDVNIKIGKPILQWKDYFKIYKF